MKPKSLKKKNLNKYNDHVGRSFENKECEKFIIKLIKLAAKHGWKFDQQERKGKTFRVTESEKYTPNGKLAKEEVCFEFTWKK